ncbi:ABC transporter [Mycolicibacillus koreensis]|nr:ABC transporter [Mycolicibacillus koreensis]
MSVALTTTMQTSFEDAVKKTREALAQNGFGVLTEIDMKATLKAKLGEDMEDYTILGACNPTLAHQAVNAYRQIGVLLPCNVVVRADPDAPGTVIIDAMNPGLMAQVTEEPELREIAGKVTELIDNALRDLGAAAG